ncbi:hypothetical protein M0R45_001976 [Rubus argutus]|uniref:Uncharacterized protein n=1 Tax=Rubus argutus TaxID=59490 RepID=A0AAW1VIF7_RUBAR
MERRVVDEDGGGAVVDLAGLGDGAGGKQDGGVVEIWERRGSPARQRGRERRRARGLDAERTGAEEEEVQLGLAAVRWR